MNSIALLGTLVTSPELRHTQDGLSIVSVLLGFASERPEEDTYTIRVVLFGEAAESAHRTLSEGDLCSVQGRLKTDTQTKADGDGKEKVIELLARKIDLVLPATAPAAAVTAAPRPAAAQKNPPDVQGQDVAPKPAAARRSPAGAQAQDKAAVTIRRSTARQATTAQAGDEDVPF